jgi:3-phosphoglycerate kinase
MNSYCPKGLSDIVGKRVIVRVDFNVPVDGVVVSDTARINSAKSTIDELLNRNNKVILISHFKNPSTAELGDESMRESFSFRGIVRDISASLGREVVLLDLFDRNVADGISHINGGAVALLDNSRLWPGEKTCDDELSRMIANLGDVFVNEAFSCAHRKHASVIGVAKYLHTLPGLHFQKEISTLNRAFDNPRHPFLAVIGGAKVSSKFPILENLLPKVDFMAIGGAMVNTFFVAEGISVGRSLYEADYVQAASNLLTQYREKLVFPCDVCAAESINNAPTAIEIAQGVYGLPDNLSAFDIGPRTAFSWAPVVHKAKTIIWNGTLGVAEQPPFDDGSRKIAQLIGENGDAFSIAGGGDTLNAISQFGLSDKFSHLCTGGGAFLEWLATSSLPAERTFFQHPVI